MWGHSADAQRQAGCHPIPPAGGRGKAARVSKAPAAGRGRHRQAGGWVAVLKLPVRLLEPDLTQVARHGHVMMTAERVLQRARSHPGTPGDLAQRDSPPRVSMNEGG